MNRPPSIATICLLMSDLSDQRLLAGFLVQTGYRVVVVAGSELSSIDPAAALMITDQAGARQYGAALFAMKARLKPLYFPVLLTLIGAGQATGWLRAGFDDVLRLPLNKDDLLARLEAFLRLRQHSADLLTEGRLRYQATFDLAPVGIVHASLGGKITLVNLHVGAILGMTTAMLSGRRLVDLVEAAHCATMQAALDAVLVAPGAQPAFDQLLCRHNGAPLWSSVTVSLARDADGVPRYLIVIIEDISVRKQLELELRESERFARATIDALNEQICVVDETGRILAVNKAWNRFADDNGMQGQTKWVGTNYLSICDRAAACGNEEARLFATGMRDVITLAQDEFSMEYQCDDGGDERWFIVKVTRFPHGGPVRLVVSHENVTHARLAQRDLSWLAHNDSLTRLPNRVLIDLQLKQTLLQAERSHWIVAVMFIDLDHFKMINDTLGHAAGDRLLQLAGQRIVGCLRVNDTVGRLGGDEFCVILPDLATVCDAAMLSEKIMHALAQPFHLMGSEAFVTSSIGIAMYPSDGLDADTLLRSADIAMYRVKKQGRDGHQYFVPRMTTQLAEQARLEGGLRRALERGELSMHYQPQIDIASGRIVGVEALMRWQHPELGMISPAVFIPIAEETGLIVSIGAWALRTACSQNRRWQEAGIAPIVMAVNMSSRQFKERNLHAMIDLALQESGLEGRYLELELTEGIMMENVAVLIDTLNRLKTLGVRLSLDDFGTGYSNLAYLKRFPLDMIKIDKSFVDDIDAGGDASLIAAAVITLGHGLHLKVIAEGVETQEQLAVLRMLGCDMIQGYLYSRPLPHDAMTALLCASVRPQLA